MQIYTADTNQNLMSIRQLGKQKLLPKSLQRIETKLFWMRLHIQSRRKDITNHCSKCNGDENKGCIAQVNIQCRSKSCWYNCERESPSVALVDRKVN